MQTKIMARCNSGSSYLTLMREGNSFFPRTLYQGHCTDIRKCGTLTFIEFLQIISLPKSCEIISLWICMEIGKICSSSCGVNGVRGGAQTHGECGAKLFS